jgi:hypothetical protein
MFNVYPEDAGGNLAMGTTTIWGRKGSLYILVNLFDHELWCWSAITKSTLEGHDTWECKPRGDWHISLGRAKQYHDFWYKTGNLKTMWNCF